LSDEEGEFEYYIAHDSIGVPHILRKLRGEPPMLGCANCSD